jgi:hypothetical protein
MTYQRLADSALDAFWNEVLRQYPQAKTGDLSPDRTIRLQIAAEHAIKEWIENNVQAEARHRVKHEDAVSKLYDYLDHNYIKLVGYSGYFALSPDRQTLFGCHELADGTRELSPILPGRMNWCEVTAPADQTFLDAVNRVFGTTFRFEAYAGR